MAAACWVKLEVPALILVGMGVLVSTDVFLIVTRLLRHPMWWVYITKLTKGTHKPAALLAMEQSTPMLPPVLRRLMQLPAHASLTLVPFSLPRLLRPQQESLRPQGLVSRQRVQQSLFLKGLIYLSVWRWLPSLPSSVACGPWPENHGPYST